MMSASCAVIALIAISSHWEGLPACVSSAHISCRDDHDSSQAECCPPFDFLVLDRNERQTRWVRGWIRGRTLSLLRITHIEGHETHAHRNICPNKRLFAVTLCLPSKKIIYKSLLLLQHDSSIAAASEGFLSVTGFSPSTEIFFPRKERSEGYGDQGLLLCPQMKLNPDPRVFFLARL